MDAFRADLHTHTFLSPCGDIGMVPSFIVEAALRNGYDIIGITDHNTTVQAREIRRMVGDGEPYILCGAEITTREEAHCLAFADSEESLDELQRFLDDNLPKIPNDEEVFGYQLAVNEAEDVIYEAPYLLISAIDKGIDEVAAFVASIGGIFIPAHIDKPHNSVISQLGFIPPGLPFDALELSAGCDAERFLDSNPWLRRLDPTFVRSSDAHYQEDYCRAVTYFNMPCRSFGEIRKALHGEDGRSVVI
ncbi:MAG TPA: PHP domain-containing protein [Candidatus Coprenecus pullistercoris]|nr:PHP domain-containing protein [Candidatus Coprenecus pullistercoris]